MNKIEQAILEAAIEREAKLYRRDRDLLKIFPPLFSPDIYAPEGENNPDYALRISAFLLSRLSEVPNKNLIFHLGALRAERALYISLTEDESNGKDD